MEKKYRVFDSTRLNMLKHTIPIDIYNLTPSLINTLGKKLEDYDMRSRPPNHIKLKIGMQYGEGESPSKIHILLQMHQVNPKDGHTPNYYVLLSITPEVKNMSELSKYAKTLFQYLKYSDEEIFTKDLLGGDGSILEEALEVNTKNLIQQGRSKRLENLITEPQNHIFNIN
ncbi:MAG: hypothetical protein KJ674_01185 [Nanoarchaeota archaeon]|nr:hypothetical protein [Nanoarchaeota archaeon]